jgi:hypothetical protein
MSVLNITEYSDTSHGNPIEPPLAHQTVPLSNEPAVSAPLHRGTKAVRIATDVDCMVSIRPDVQPAAHHAVVGAILVGRHAFVLGLRCSAS